MSATYTITCPSCRATTTVTTGFRKRNSGVGTCEKCLKNVRVYVDGKGNIIKVEIIMSPYKGLYVQRLSDGTIVNVQVEDTAGNSLSLDPFLSRA